MVLKNKVYRTLKPFNKAITEAFKKFELETSLAGTSTAVIVPTDVKTAVTSIKHAAGYQVFAVDINETRLEQPRLLPDQIIAKHIDITNYQSVSNYIINPATIQD